MPLRNIPRKPTGFDGEATAFQALHDGVFGPAAQLCSSSTVKVSRTSRGTFLSVAAPARVTAGSEVRFFKFVSILSDLVMIGHTWDAGTATEGADDVYIALPPLLRGPTEQPTRTFPDIGTVTYTYYLTTQHRHASWDSGASTEEQYITDLYIAGDILVCAKMVTGIGVGTPAVPVEWQDVNVDGRFWAAE